ncbi:MAG: (d)CMP kinase [Candidatus Enteromonas sp.]|nr:(d)CMP kinase [bacterium]MDY6100514.1 (d)CMP kinase [Candidatus Enteromonas sp.]
MSSFVSIAIDGPAAAGKSTVAKIVAKKLGYVYIDTGAMYRAFTYAVIKAGLDPKNEEQACSLVGKVSIELTEDGCVLCNGEDVSKPIRGNEVSSNVSYIASYKTIRLELIKLQRELASHQNVVMDGRDIGSYVLPDAQVKVFQVASVETRAKRRYDENLAKGIQTSLEEVAENVRQRDYIDSHRDFDPLVKDKDAIELDTSNLNIEESAAAVLQIVAKKLGEKQ